MHHGQLTLATMMTFGLWTAPPPPTPEVKALIRQLADPQFIRREIAAERLKILGRGALTGLEKAKNDQNPLVAKRAAELLDGVKAGFKK